MNFESVSQSNPCHICGKSDWCSRTADGKYHICRRVHQDGGKRKVDSAGCEYFVYLNKGHQYDV